MIKLLLITFALNFFFKMNEYKVLPVPDLKARLEHESKGRVMNFDVQLKHSNALVYFLKSGEVILLPNSLSDRSTGLLFENKKIYEMYLSLESFPIQNEYMAFEELFQNEILNLGSNIKEVIHYLDSLDTDRSYEGSSLENILTSLKLRVKKVTSDKEIMFRSLILGEFIKSKVGGEWILLKQYGSFNPYYTPAILKNDGLIIELMLVVDFYFTESDFSLSSLLKLPYIKEPVLKINSEIFDRTYAGYKFI